MGRSDAVCHQLPTTAVHACPIPGLQASPFVTPHLTCGNMNQTGLRRRPCRREVADARGGRTDRRGVRLRAGAGDRGQVRATLLQWGPRVLGARPVVTRTAAGVLRQGPPRRRHSFPGHSSVRSAQAGSTQAHVRDAPAPRPRVNSPRVTTSMWPWPRNGRLSWGVSMFCLSDRKLLLCRPVLSADCQSAVFRQTPWGGCSGCRRRRCRGRIRT